MNVSEPNRDQLKNKVFIGRSGVPEEFSCSGFKAVCCEDQKSVWAFDVYE